MLLYADNLNFIIHIFLIVLFDEKNYNVPCGGAKMDYMTLKEAAEKWGVSPRRVNYYCAGERIPGAVKMAGVWLVPKDAEKPRDKRWKK